MSIHFVAVAAWNLPPFRYKTFDNYTHILTTINKKPASLQENNLTKFHRTNGNSTSYNNKQSNMKVTNFEADFVASLSYWYCCSVEVIFPKSFPNTGTEANLKFS
jgi:hypothetical protein